MYRFIKKHYKYLFFIAVPLVIAYYFCLPQPIFNDPVSTVLEDRQGELLGARIASDGQWRFPYNDSVPDKFSQAIISFEDKRFYYHPGVDPLAMLRALYLNISQGHVVSGGSTLSMQVIRLARKGQSRTLWEKFIEVILATRLELRHSKAEILAYYASNAPFGGNVVGLDAASWKYYTRPPNELSWAEATTLAVLPNSPALIHPGRNRAQLRQKRDGLLTKLYETGVIDSTTAYLAQLEPLPERPLPLPMVANHLLDREQNKQRRLGKKSVVKTTVSFRLQEQMNSILQRHHQRLVSNGIQNGAILVLEVATGDVMAYVGNAACQEGIAGCAVDVIPATRSTGSVIKPLLYASTIQAGEMLPDMLVPDVPSQFGGYSPQNYDSEYDGALPFSSALARSLNVPFVHVLSKHGVPKFHDFTKNLGINSLNRGPQHYGLSLILGGAEASLWEVTGVYASLARNLNNYSQYSGQYDPNAFHSPNYYFDQRKLPLSYEQRDQLQDHSLVNAGAIWHTFESMVEVARPGEEGHWRNFNSSGKVAWKTGTSFGFRDAWAIGCTPEYVVGVWIGNASGEGRPGLVGVAAAAPVLFDAFSVLGTSNAWFEMPYDEMRQIPLCRKSGHRASKECPEQDSTWVYQAGLRTAPCPYHQLIHVDQSEQWRVHSDCELPANMKHIPYFVLPPVQESYYKNKYSFTTLPPYRADCLASLPVHKSQSMELVYPKFNTRIFVPTDLDGQESATIFEVAHRKDHTTIYWHLDGEFIGQTKQFHEMALAPTVGKHQLVLVDIDGERLERKFEIIGKKED